VSRNAFVFGFRKGELDISIDRIVQETDQRVTN
jgi:hypothetical protein